MLRGNSSTFCEWITIVLLMGSPPFLFIYWCSPVLCGFFFFFWIQMCQSLIKDGKAHFNVVTALLLFSYTKRCYFVSRQLNFGGCFCFTCIDVLFRLGMYYSKNLDLYSGISSSLVTLQSLRIIQILSFFKEWSGNGAWMMHCMFWSVGCVDKLWNSSGGPACSIFM